MSAEPIPMIDTNAMECSAGCLANTNAPAPKTVVITDKMTEVLYVGNFVFISLC